MNERRREYIALAAIVGVGVVLRVVWCIVAARPPAGLHDPLFYRALAEGVARGNGYHFLAAPDDPTAYYPVGYPASLVPGLWLLEHTPLPDSWFTGLIAAQNIVWQALAIVGVHVAARLVSGRAAAGLVAAAVVAWWPNLVIHTALALTESLFLALLVGALVLSLRGPWDGSPVPATRLLAIGALVGAATLVRPVSLPLVPAFLLAHLVARNGWRPALRHTGIVAAGALVVVTPWLVRNAVVMGEPTLSTNTGDNLCIGRRIDAPGGFEIDNPRCLEGDFDDLERPEYELERDAFGRRQAIEFVREHPGEEVRLWFRRAYQLFRNDADGVAAVESYGDDPFLDPTDRTRLRTVSNWFYAVVGPLGVVALGALVLRRPRLDPRAVFLALTFLGVLAPPIVFFGDPRFHVPAVPIVAIGLGAVAADVVARARRAPVGSSSSEPEGPIGTA
ncbi:MAG TPA: hypothetical protein VFZ83_04820 [Acidimicrobiia bacterium]|nr:hypothetical protein [Acidimicrobiia bacterium]